MKENISALLDGETNGLEHERTLRALGSDPALCATWQRYHLAGTAIRRELEVMAGPGCSARIQELLRDEAPLRMGRGAFLRSRQAVKLGAGAAIAAAVAAVAILNLGPTLVPTATPLAKRPAASTLADARQARPEQRNALNPYLMQHGEFTPAAGMNGMLSYVRVVGRNSAIIEVSPAQNSPLSENANAE